MRGDEYIRLKKEWIFIRDPHGEFYTVEFEDKNREFMARMAKNIEKCSTILSGRKDRKKREQGVKRMKCSKVEVEGIKLAVSRFYRTDAILCRDILKESIRWLKERYEGMKDDKDLYKALCHIQAFAELGFPYDDVKEETAEIFDLLKVDEEVKKEFRKHFCEKVIINKTRVNRLLGKWNPARQSMHIGDAVNDIIQKVTEQEEGIYLYHCGKQIVSEVEGGLWEHTFRLQVQDGDAIFHNVNQNKYYLLMREDEYHA